MKQVERIGVSLEKELLSRFDKHIDQQGYQNRSEAVRDLVRRELSKKKLSNPNTRAFGTLGIVYNHHSTKLMQKLTDFQHSHLLETICSMHIHLDAHNCMEVVVLKGNVGQINKISEKILSQKGVKLGRLNLVEV